MLLSPHIRTVSIGVDSPLILGAFEIGVMVSIFLFGTVMFQAYIYWGGAKDDRLWLRILVVMVIFLELAHTISSCYALYIFTVQSAGLPELLKPGNTYPLALTPVFELLITALVQGFFTYRIHLLSGRRLVPGICAVLAVVRLGGGCVTAAESFVDVPRQPDGARYQFEFGWLITAAINVGVVLDVLITVALCYYIRRLYGAYSLPGGRRIIDKLVVWTIETGLITSLTSVAVGISVGLSLPARSPNIATGIQFATMKENFVWLALYTFLAKMYSNSLLASLNSRSISRKIVRVPLPIHAPPAPPPKDWLLPVVSIAPIRPTPAHGRGIQRRSQLDMPLGHWPLATGTPSAYDST
ncbi:hypothetical protein MIND_00807100 [Mycena indigotica]|uniref:DUF6534 domain-containing protein n=1 Tax=Mycena indigotica TaxID=2126181 RepID=A0A8H6SH57_9AGAR|nr:uncharacterized protein MIND_00807100 [Mycena indigotica]KAF7298601.1 hypothetical protein MIND_00807100 [Mycena indigotica]